MEKRRDRLLRDESHDPTKSKRKPVEPTVCTGCGATVHRGRWAWGKAAVDSLGSLCAACERIRVGYPSGFVTIRGRFAREHRDEIERITKNVEAREMLEHPINRILSVIEEEDALVVQTTEAHLAQAIGKALQRAFNGELEFSFEEDVVRIDWHRD